MPEIIQLNGTDVSVEFRKSKRAKRLSMRFAASDYVVVVAPVKCQITTMRTFYKQHLNWLKHHHLQLLSAKDSAIEKIRHEAGWGRVTVFGKVYRYEIIRGDTQKIIFIRSESFLQMTIPKSTPKDQEIALLLNQLKALLNEYLSDVLMRYVALYQLQPRSIKLKRQTSRWGSCGINNDIQLNWSLFQAPKPVIDYVLVHELCHLAIRNHSKQFWLLVGKHMPTYQKQRNWLRNNGDMLLTVFD